MSIKPVSCLHPVQLLELFEPVLAQIDCIRSSFLFEKHQRFQVFDFWIKRMASGFVLLKSPGNVFERGQTLGEGHRRVVEEKGAGVDIPGRILHRYTNLGLLISEFVFNFILSPTKSFEFLMHHLHVECRGGTEGPEIDPELHCCID